MPSRFTMSSTSRRRFDKASMAVHSRASRAERSMVSALTAKLRVVLHQAHSLIATVSLYVFCPQGHETGVAHGCKEVWTRCRDGRILCLLHLLPQTHEAVLHQVFCLVGVGGEVGGKEAQLPIMVVEELLKIDVACQLLLSHDFL